jgi:hypothetical protein
MSPTEEDALTEEQALLAAELPQDVVARIDEALLAKCTDQWRKVARIIGSVMSSLPDRPKGIPDVYYARRMAILVERGLLESQGNLRKMGEGEVRLASQ